MAVRSAISPGFPGPNYVVELGKREAALPGEYIVEGGQAIVTVVTGQIANLTLAATGQVIVAAASSPTIGNLMLSATGNIAVTASLTETIDPITLAATGQVIVSAAVDTAIGDITVAATATVSGGSTRPGDLPWWWPAYVRRYEAEREARREALAVTGEGATVLPVFVAEGLVEHDDPKREASAVTGDGVAILPTFVGEGLLEHDADADCAEVLAALLPLLGTVVDCDRLIHVGAGGIEDDPDRDIVEVLAALTPWL